MGTDYLGFIVLVCIDCFFWVGGFSFCILRYGRRMIVFAYAGTLDFGGFLMRSLVFAVFYVLIGLRLQYCLGLCLLIEVLLV